MPSQRSRNPIKTRTLVFPRTSAQKAAALLLSRRRRDIILRRKVHIVGSIRGPFVFRIFRGEFAMLTEECLGEIRDCWLPHLTDTGLDRLIELLEKDSPYLVHGCFAKALPQGCLATHAAWNHPRTAHLNMDAGITWLHHVAGLNPATSHLIRAWDSRTTNQWELRQELLAIFHAERRRRARLARISACRSCELAAVLG
jgi:hypothetical protein